MGKKKKQKKGLIDALFDFTFDPKRFKNPYTDKVNDVIFNSILYTALNSDKKQEAEQTKDMIKKIRGF